MHVDCFVLDLGNQNHARRVNRKEIHTCNAVAVLSFVIHDFYAHQIY